MSFFTNIFSNAVSFISSVFFTKEEESEFDNLYLESENEQGQVTGVQIGELAALVPEVIPSPYVPPAGLVEVPGEGSTGLVIVQPAAVSPAIEQTTDFIDLLAVHKMYTKIPVYTNKITNKEFNVTQIDVDANYNNMSKNDRTQNTKNKNTYYKDISKIEFCIEIVNPDDPVTYDYILSINNDTTKLGFINLQMYNPTKPIPFLKYENINQNSIQVNTENKTIKINNGAIGDTDIVNNIKNALEALDTCIIQKKAFESINADELKMIFFNKNDKDLYRLPNTSSRLNPTRNGYYLQNMTKSASILKISPNVNLVISYSYDSINKKDYNISFSYVVAPVKTQKKTLLTEEMVDVISDKLNNNKLYVDGLFGTMSPFTTTPPTPTEYIFIPGTFNFNESYISIYDFNSSGAISENFSSKLTKLQDKPHTLLKYDSLNTYLNILISMLDKPHDIIGKRVPEEIQTYMLNTVVTPNIKAYITYLKTILESVAGSQDKITEFNKFIEFVNHMVFTFTNNATKYVNSEVTYENAIMLFVCKILETKTSLDSLDTNIKTTKNDLLQDLNVKFPIANLTTNDIVINPDIMYLTKDITERVNQKDNPDFRKYFSAPEVIDHGHVYNINANTNIQFPENYKQIQLKDGATDNYFTIHSYSETTNEPAGTSFTNLLYYNVYVWFSTQANIPKCLIKYKTPFMNAPDCAGVYAGYKTIDAYKQVNKIFTDIAKQFTDLSKDMQNLIPYLMLDQFYNAKSLQDDQNQLQVNQITTISPLPSSITINAESLPTQFLGLCCDLTSAANGFNYYMSRQPGQRNLDSIVGYYHSAKKIWITEGNKIKFQIITAPQKSASKDIFSVLNINNILSNSTGGGGNNIRDTNKRKFDNNPVVKKDWEDDDTKIEEYGQYVYYNTMADWLYQDDNFNKYDLNVLFRQVKYEVNRKEYLSSNCFFDIFSNDFVDKMIKMLKIYPTQPNIQKQDVNKIIQKCAIYILTKFKLTPDNIVPPNEQINLSNDLDTKYFEIINAMINNPKENDVARGNNEVEVDYSSDASVDSHYGSPVGVDFPFSQDGYESNFSEDESPLKKKRTGGFFKKRTNKKRTIRKRTNKKRTIRKRTNKKKTIKKKIKRTIYKTRKMH